MSNSASFSAFTIESFVFSSSRNLQDHYMGLEGQLKAFNCPTTLAQGPQTKNSPLLEGGIFWNNNHLLRAQAMDDARGDPIFEAQIFRNHLQVLKYVLKDYLAPHEEMEDPEEEQIPRSFLETDIIKREDIKIYREVFLAEVKRFGQFKQNQLKLLKEVIEKNPTHLNLFYIFGQAAPSKCLGRVYYLIFQGLLTIEQLGPGPLQSQRVINYVEERVLSIGRMGYQKIQKIILYSIIMCVSGSSRNQYHENLRKNEDYTDKLILTKFERHLNGQGRNKTKKVKVLRRPRPSATEMNMKQLELN